jgi:putative spermidine/putrescine transport system substrate-binding protein
MSRNISRRAFLKTGLLAGAAGVTILSGCAPSSTPAPAPTAVPPTAVPPTAVPAATQVATAAVVCQPSTGVKISTIGLGVSVQDRFLREFECDSGHKIDGTAGGYPEFTTKWITGGYKTGFVDEPNAAYSVPIFGAGSIQPIPISKVKKWNTLRPLFTDPNDPGADKSGAGWPTKPIYTPDAIKSGKYDEVVGVPHFFGMDSIGFRRDLLKENIDSYGALYDAQYLGKTAIWNDPIIPVQQCANYLVHAGKLKPKDRPANLQTDEIDQVIEFLIERKKAGQFRVIWEDYGQAVNLLATGEVLIIDAWSPIIFDVIKQGKDAVYAKVKEGYPLWFHMMCISSAVKPDSAEYNACLDYIDYWLGGKPGAAIAAQGYYSPSTTCEPILKEMHSFGTSMSDYDAWYMGKIGWPVGGIADRMANIGICEEYPDNADYHIKRWKDFLAA